MAESRQITRFYDLPRVPAIRRDMVDTHVADARASAWVLSPARRLFDIAVSAAILLFAALPMLAIAAVVRLNSRGNAIFRQERVGRGGRLFKIYKFRSMAHTASEKNGPGLTKDGDVRVTAVGRLLRKSKLDELPQFVNVLRGEMSLVGPRPKLPQRAESFDMPYRPGITGPSALAFFREEELLRDVEESEIEDFYARVLKPQKASLDARYMGRATPASDALILCKTLLWCLHLNAAPLRSPDEMIPANPLIADSSGLRQPAGGD